MRRTVQPEKRLCAILPLIARIL